MSDMSDTWHERNTLKEEVAAANRMVEIYKAIVDTQAALIKSQQAHMEQLVNPIRVQVPDGVNRDEPFDPIAEVANELGVSVDHPEWVINTLGMSDQMLYLREEAGGNIWTSEVEAATVYGPSAARSMIASMGLTDAFPTPYPFVQGEMP